MATEARQKAQAKYNSKPEQVKRRAARNQARRLAIKEGRASKGDGKDVAHVDNNPMNNSKSNRKMQSPAQNRSIKRNSKAKRA